jgi:hypothetical protein
MLFLGEESAVPKPKILRRRKNSAESGMIYILFGSH